MQFQDRVAIVTGASQGIGKAVAQRLALGSARLLLADIQGEKVGSVAEEIRREEGVALSLEVDVSNAQDVGRMVQLALGNSLADTLGCPRGRCRWY